MKGNKLGTSTIVAIVILVIAVICMFLLLNYSAKAQKAKVQDFGETTVTTTVESTEAVDITVDALPEINEVEDDVEINASNFSSSIGDILSGYEELGDYKIELFYNGAKFNFNCTNYNEETSTCVAGSALMNTGSAVLPLYTYDNPDDNYYNHSDDYYILINDNNIFLTSNYAGKNVGTIKIYDRQGNYISEIGNVITGYIEEEVFDNGYYPNVTEENNIFYYACENNQVKIKGMSLNDFGTIIRDELVENSRCY